MTHSTSDIWQKLEGQDAKIGTLAAGQAATDQRLEGLERTVHDGFQQVHRALSRMAESAARPTPWVGIGMLILGVMALFGTYSFLLNQPLQQGQITASNDILYLRAELNLLREYDRETQRLLGEISATSEENANLIAAVDRFGSRRWNREAPLNDKEQD